MRRLGWKLISMFSLFIGGVILFGFRSSALDFRLLWWLPALLLFVASTQKGEVFLTKKRYLASIFRVVGGVFIVPTGYITGYLIYMVIRSGGSVFQTGFLSWFLIGLALSLPQLLVGLALVRLPDRPTSLSVSR